MRRQPIVQVELNVDYAADRGMMASFRADRVAAVQQKKASYSGRTDYVVIILDNNDGTKIETSVPYNDVLELIGWAEAKEEQPLADDKDTELELQTFGVG